MPAGSAGTNVLLRNAHISPCSVQGVGFKGVGVGEQYAFSYEMCSLIEYIFS